MSTTIRKPSAPILTFPISSCSNRRASTEVERAVRATHAEGVLLGFGGQTPINLARELAARGVRSLGSDHVRSTRRKTGKKIRRRSPAAWRVQAGGRAALSFRKAREIARELGISGDRPAIVRARRARHGDRVQRGAARVVAASAPPILPHAPLLVDKYLSARRSKPKPSMTARRS